jgi:hypothetical protein
MLTETRNASLDELVIGALNELTNAAEPLVRQTEAYFKFEILTEDDVELDIDIAVTGRFMRWSTPYERVDLDAALGSPPFAQAPQPAETVAFDKQWFDDADDAVAAIAATEEPVIERPASWTWLAISVAVAGLAVAVAEYLV